MKHTPANTQTIHRQLCELLHDLGDQGFSDEAILAGLGRTFAGMTESDRTAVIAWSMAFIEDRARARLGEPSLFRDAEPSE